MPRDTTDAQEKLFQQQPTTGPHTSALQRDDGGAQNTRKKFDATAPTPALRKKCYSRKLAAVAFKVLRQGRTIPSNSPATSLYKYRHRRCHRFPESDPTDAEEQRKRSEKPPLATAWHYHFTGVMLAT